MVYGDSSSDESSVYKFKKLRACILCAHFVSLDRLALLDEHGILLTQGLLGLYLRLGAYSP